MRVGVQTGDRDKERTWMREVCDQVLEGAGERDLMNGGTRAKGQLPADKAVTNRGTGGERRGEGQAREAARRHSFEKSDEEALPTTFTANLYKLPSHTFV